MAKPAKPAATKPADPPDDDAPDNEAEEAEEVEEAPPQKPAKKRPDVTMADVAEVERGLKDEIAKVRALVEVEDDAPDEDAELPEPKRRGGMAAVVGVVVVLLIGAAVGFGLWRRHKAAP